MLNTFEKKLRYFDACQIGILRQRIYQHLWNAQWKKITQSISSNI